MLMFFARCGLIALAILDDQHFFYRFRPMLDLGDPLPHDFALRFGPWYVTLDGVAFRVALATAHLAVICVFARGFMARRKQSAIAS